MSNLSFPYLAKGAIEGNIEFQYILGCHYLNGDHVYKDIQEAIHWWTKAGNEGHRTAQYNLGAIYLSMNQYENYLEISQLWLQKAADNGCYKSKDILKFLESQMLADKNNIN
jgi:TPR repeat protein